MQNLFWLEGKLIKGDFKEVTYGYCKCGCGNEFTTRSTKKDIHVEICSVCHPFYTGKQKFVDTAGRIDRFNKKYGGDYFKKNKDKK